MSTWKLGFRRGEFCRLAKFCLCYASGHLSVASVYIYLYMCVCVSACTKPFPSVHQLLGLSGWEVGGGGCKKLSKSLNDWQRSIADFDRGGRGEIKHLKTPRFCRLRESILPISFPLPLPFPRRYVIGKDGS